MEYNILLNELDKLNLPADSYAITSSGPLAVRDIRETNDVDIIVTPELWRNLESKYKVQLNRNFLNIDVGNIQILGPGTHFIRDDIKSAYDQINEADIIEGRRYVRLETIKKFKKILGREKDLKDILLIEDYMHKSS